MRVERKVRIISLHKRYRQNIYPFAVSFNQSTGKFLTGQEDVLTYEKMIGKIQLTKAEKDALSMGDQPILINPELHYPLKHGRTFDLSCDEDEKKHRIYENPKDYADFGFFTIQPEVAKDKSSYKKGKHYFYVEDKEKEAEFQLIHNDKCYEAENLIREKTSTGSYPDVVMLLNMYAPGYNIDPDVLSDIQMKHHIIEACRKYPDVILMFGKKDIEEIIFASKLVKYNIVERKNGMDFYYKGDFIGTTIDSIRDWTRKPERNELVSKWAKQINKPKVK